MRVALAALAALAALGACSSEAPADALCGDGRVLCPTGVCVADDGLCPANPRSFFANDELYDTRLYHALGSDACGGMLHRGSAHVYRWTVSRQPGQLIVEYFDLDHQVPDRRLELDFESPTRLTGAREWQDLANDPDVHTWSFDDQDRLLRYRVDPEDDGDVGTELVVQRHERHIFARTTSEFAFNLDVATTDASGRIVHVDGFTDEVDAHVGASADIEHGPSGPTRIEISSGFLPVSLNLDYAYDPAGRLVRRTFDSGDGWYFTYDADGRLLELSILGASSGDPDIYTYDYECD